MRKLILQVQMSIDGFVASPDGGLDWMTWDWDDDLKKYVMSLTGRIGTILLGRKMTDGFVKYWTEAAANPAGEEYPFAKIMVDTPKIVFTKTLDKSRWDNTVLAKGDITEEVNRIKENTEKDIIVYGGSGFVSGLIENGLIDEYHLFINPAAIGGGMTIFSERKNLELKNAVGFPCGIVHLHYEPKK
jgi:dihydrofolate reductase